MKGRGMPLRAMAHVLLALPLLLWEAEAKGGYSGSTGGGYSGGYSYSGGYYSSGGVVASRYSYATAGAFGAIILLNAGSRRRYGVYHDSADSSQCLLASEDEMRSACANLMTNETMCHDCIACETEGCMNSITNCDEFLATVFTECCTEECDGGDAVIGAIVGVVVTGLICMCGCFIAFNIMKKAGASVQGMGEAEGGSPVPYGSQPPPYGMQPSYGQTVPYGGAYQVPGQTGGVAQGQVVQGQVVGYQNKAA